MSEANKLGGLASCKNDEFGGCEETLRSNRCFVLLINGHHLAICPACNWLDKAWAAIHEHVPSRRGFHILRSTEPDDLEALKQAFIRSGMRETHCVQCGSWMLTRTDNDRCPDCRKVPT